MSAEPRRVGRVLAAVACLGVLVAAAVLFAAGARRNAEITDLRHHGVPIVATVTNCLGQLGGSGSNAAGYTCWGVFTLDGQSYREQVPGNKIRGPGTHVEEVVAADDPSLVATPAGLTGERSSIGVFVLPAVLLALLGAVPLAVAFSRRCSRSPISRRLSARRRVALVRLGARRTA